MLSILIVLSWLISYSSTSNHRIGDKQWYGSKGGNECYFELQSKRISGAIRNVATRGRQWDVNWWWKWWEICWLRHLSFSFLTKTAFYSFTVNVVDGEVLSITKVSRLHMAAYLCVASNGVPPSISKRVQLKVQCKHNLYYLIWFQFLLKIIKQFLQCYLFQINSRGHTLVKMWFLNVTLKLIRHQSIIGLQREAIW